VRLRSTAFPSGGGVPDGQNASVVSRIKVMASEQNSVMKIEEAVPGWRVRPHDRGAPSTSASRRRRRSSAKDRQRIFDKDKAKRHRPYPRLKMSARMELKYRRCVPRRDQHRHRADGQRQDHDAARRDQ
jgi:hypothetical protein